MLKVIIGAGNTKFDGWISSQERELNLLIEDLWKKNFELESVDAFLAEHVWEHLTYEEGIIAEHF